MELESVHQQKDANLLLQRYPLLSLSGEERFSEESEMSFLKNSDRNQTKLKKSEQNYIFRFISV